MMNKITLGVLAGLLAILLCFCYQVAQPFLRPILLSIAMAIAFQPIYRWIGRWLGYSTRAAFLTTLLALVLTLVPLVLMVMFVTPEVKGLYETLNSKSIEQGGWAPYASQMLEKPWAWASRYVPLPEMSTGRLRDELIQNARSISKFAMHQTGALVGGVASFLIGAVIVYALLFFLLRDGRRFIASVSELVPMAQAYTARFVHVASESIIANVYAVFAVALVQGTLIALGFTIVGLSAPVMWGFAAAACSTIPFVGTPVVWGPGVIMLALKGEYWQAIFLGIWCLTIVGFSDNLIRLIIVSGREKRHPVLVFFSIVGGLKAFGFIGLLLGPVVVSLTIAVATALHEELQRMSASADAATDGNTDAGE
ncbi:MAG: AI-2E family transporter [bacterium]|nr:AI-2E family transporter [bacterium]